MRESMQCSRERSPGNCDVCFLSEHSLLEERNGQHEQHIADGYLQLGCRCAALRSNAHERRNCYDLGASDRSGSIISELEVAQITRNWADFQNSIRFFTPPKQINSHF